MKFILFLDDHIVQYSMKKNKKIVTCFFQQELFITCESEGIFKHVSFSTEIYWLWQWYVQGRYFINVFFKNETTIRLPELKPQTLHT